MSYNSWEHSICILCSFLENLSQTTRGDGVGEWGIISHTPLVLSLHWAPVLLSHLAPNRAYGVDMAASSGVKKILLHEIIWLLRGQHQMQGL